MIIQNVLIKVGINDKYGLINELGEEVIPIKYDRIHYPGYEDIIVAELKGKVGVISRQGCMLWLLALFTFENYDIEKNAI